MNKQKRARQRNWNVFRLKGVIANLDAVRFAFDDKDIEIAIENAIYNAEFAVKRLEQLK